MGTTGGGDRANHTRYIVDVAWPFGTWIVKKEDEKID